MDEQKQNTTPSDDIEICCCPICSSEEFLLSENNDMLICIHCGKVPLSPPTRQSQSRAIQCSTFIHQASMIH